jgi:hypothetical protein
VDQNKNARIDCKIPREAVRIMSGFSDDVAMAVTQPACPGNEPRKRKDSAMLCRTIVQNLFLYNYRGAVVGWLWFCTAVTIFRM